MVNDGIAVIEYHGNETERRAFIKAEEMQKDYYGKDAVRPPVMLKYPVIYRFLCNEEGFVCKVVQLSEQEVKEYREAKYGVKDKPAKKRSKA